MNCYVVVEDDGLTLVGSTTSSPAPEVAILVQEQGLELGRGALTVAHGDQVGGVAGVWEQFPGVGVALGRRGGPILAGDKGLLADEPQAPVNGYFVKVDWKPGKLLVPGDRVGSLEVVAAPGHTPGHVAFLHVRDRSLIAGDAYQTRAGIAVSGVLRPLFPFPAMATWHKPTALATAEVLHDLKPSRLAVGHGDTLEAPNTAMAGAIEAAKKAFG